MKRQRDPEELRQLADRAKVLLRFMSERSDDRTVFGAMELALEKSVARSNARGVRMLVRDVAEWARTGLTPHQLEQLDESLLERFGVRLDGLYKAEGLSAAEIVRRGEIQNSEEYRVLMGRVEEIHSDSSKQGEVEAINSLLSDFHRKRSTT